MDIFLAGIVPGSPKPARPLVVYNHRSDRPQRLLNFAATAFSRIHASQILVTGERPALTAWLALRRLSGLPPIRFVPGPRLPAVLTEFAADCQAIVFCGNIHGLNVSGILGS